MMTNPMMLPTSPLPIPEVFLASLLLAMPCLAASTVIDSAAFELGAADKVQMVRISIQSDWSADWFTSNTTHLSGYWDLGVAQWRGDAYQNKPDKHQNITVATVTPVLRFERTDKKGWFCEAGIGVNLLSELYNNNGDQLSTHFQFSEHLGVGYIFENRWELGAKIQHHSNGGIDEPNDGVNWLLMKVAYHF